MENRHANVVISGNIEILRNVEGHSSEYPRDMKNPCDPIVKSAEVLLCSIEIPLRSAEVLLSSTEILLKSIKVLLNLTDTAEFG